MKILITGGCGFIGTALTAHIIKNYKNYKIIIIDNFTSSSEKFFKKSIKYFTKKKINDLKIQIIKGDITNFDLVLKASKKCKIVIHLAASTGVDISIKNPSIDFNNNVFGTFNILEACRINKIKKLILASSGAVVGNVDPPINENILPKPISPYGASKLFKETYASSYSYSYNISTISLRFSNVYGPGSNFKNSVVSKFIKDYIISNKNEIYGSGNQTRDFIYIDDLISAILKSMLNKKLKNEVFQISTNKETNLIYLNKLILKSLKKLGYKNLKTEFKPFRFGDVKKNYSDNTKALKLLNWKPKTYLKDGVISTVNYFNALLKNQ